MNCTEHLLILACTVTWCVSIFAFASLIDIPVGVASSQTAINICMTTAGITNYKSIIKKKKKKHDKAIRRNGDKLYVKWKGNHNSFNSWIHRKDIIIQNEFFPEPYTCSKNKIKCELDLPNYATKSDPKKT